MPRNFYELKTAYKYAELDDDAKNRVKEWLNQEYNWSAEAWESLEAFAKHFGGYLADYSIDWAEPSRSYVKFSMPDLGYHELARLLGELGSVNPETGKGMGDCKLTGCCMDEDLADGAREEFAKLTAPDPSAQWDEDGDEIDDWDLLPSDEVNDVMQMAWWELAQSARRDYESQWEDGVVNDTCEANGYEFDKHGNLI